MTARKPRRYLYIVESCREHGRWMIESVCFTRAEARKLRRHYANAKTPRVRVTQFERGVWQPGWKEC